MLGGTDCDVLNQFQQLHVRIYHQRASASAAACLRRLSRRPSEAAAFFYRHLLDCSLPCCAVLASIHPTVAQHDIRALPLPYSHNCPQTQAAVAHSSPSVNQQTPTPTTAPRRGAPRVCAAAAANVITETSFCCCCRLTKRERTPGRCSHHKTSKHKLV